MAMIACLLELIIGICYFSCFKEWLAPRYTNPVTIISSFLLIFEGIPGLVRIGLNNPAWYLCVLLQCYVIYYIVDRVAKKKAILFFLSLIVVLTACRIIGIVPAFMANSARGYSAFFIGMLLFYYKDNPRIKYLIIPDIIVGLALLVISPARYYWTLLFCFFPLLVYFGAKSDFHVIPIIDKMSAISFDVYLFHVPTYYALLFLFRLCNINIQHSYLTMLGFLMSVIAVAVGAHFFVEEKISNILRRI